MERDQLKQRLLGMIVLIAAAAVIVMLLLFSMQRGGGRDWRRQSIAPQPAEQDLVTRVLPLPKVNREPAESLPVDATATPASTAPSVSAVPPTVTVPSITRQGEQSTVLSERPVPVASLPHAAGWVVQLGSFTSKKNAEALKTRLLPLGSPTFVEASRRGKVLTYRVRIGPYTQRRSADMERAKVQRRAPMLYVVVLPYP